MDLLIIFLDNRRIVLHGQGQRLQHAKFNRCRMEFESELEFEKSLSG